MNERPSVRVSKEPYRCFGVIYVYTYAPKASSRVEPLPQEWVEPYKGMGGALTPDGESPIWNIFNGHYISLTKADGKKVFLKRSLRDKDVSPKKG